MTDLEQANARIEELEEMIDAARVAASETAPDWRTRCHRVLAAIGLNFGDGEEESMQAIRDLDMLCGVLLDAHPGYQMASLTCTDFLLRSPTEIRQRAMRALRVAEDDD